MVTKVNLSIRPVKIEDRQSLANLIHFETQVHRHLDWRPPLDWVGHHPYLVAEQDREVVAALACPPDPPDIAWIRLFAVASHIDEQDAWHSLWSMARDYFAADKDVMVAAIPLQGWFRKLLQESGFTLTNKVIMLVWELGRLPPEKVLPGIIIRPMNLDDLTSVEELDATAFGPVWRNSRSSLELAFNQAAVATVAEMNGSIVGYQISTANHLGGHLARLATHPEFQGMGIGYVLIRDMLAQFERRGGRRVTVNTQQDNIASLALYEKTGFRHTGETYPVFQYNP